MIYTLREYSSLSAGSEETFNFNAKVLNGLGVHNSANSDTLQISVRVGNQQLISDVSLAGLNSVLAPKLKNRDANQFTIPFGNVNTVNNTITVTVKNSHSSTAKTTGLYLIYDNGKASKQTPVKYKSYTSATFSATGVISCSAHMAGTGALASSTSKVTWNHGSVSETSDLQSYHQIFTSTANNIDTKGATIMNGAPNTLNLSGVYASGDEYVVAYI